MYVYTCRHLVSSQFLEHLDWGGGFTVSGCLLRGQAAVHLHLQCEVCIHLVRARERERDLA